jgi:glucan phosphoethanolaminetransferase (alkaline phosphatase superfamily)
LVEENQVMQSLSKTTQLQVASYTFTVAICVLALAGWGAVYQWHLTPWSAYMFFPLFGLVAFSILWSQYVVLAMAKAFGIKTKALGKYFSVTGWVFLTAIFLHPGLLIWQLWRDGFGLPPESYLKHYVAPGLEWAALLGSVSFLIFLAYELHRWYGERSWWKYIAYLTDIAAVAIFIHSFKLGTTIHSGWFRGVWIIYGVTLLISLMYIRIYPLVASKKD